MADFYQNGPIATLNRLCSDVVPELEEELVHYAKESPISLVLPALAREMDGEALPHIVRELRGADYVSEIVIALGRADEEDYQRALDFFSPFPRKKILWLDAPPFQGLVETLVN